MRILEKIEDYLNESPKTKRTLESEIEKTRTSKKPDFRKVLKNIDMEFKNGNITAQEADILRDKIDNWEEALSWRGSYR